MHRLVVALLAAFDALIAAAVGVAVVLAPLAVFWATSLHADWSALWPTAAAVWQAGNLVPLVLHVPTAVLSAAALPAEAATFTLSLAPLAFAAFAALFAARSGGRAAHAGAWLTGVIAGGATFAALGAVIWWTSRNGTAAVWGWQALLFPALVYGVPLLIGALVGAWREGDDGGLVDRAHDWVDEHADSWSEVPALAVRGLAIILVSFVALGALAVTVGFVLRGGEVVALYQSAGVDLWGAILITLASLAYLPVMVVWGFSWIAGPGFAVGTGSAVSPAGTHLGVVPGVPLFGLLPEGGSVWLLALALLPVAVAAAAGWALRSQYVRVVGAGDPLLPRVALTGILVAGSAGAAALFAWLAGGAIGPGLLAEVGPHPGWLALVVGGEVLLGAGILLLAPRGESEWDAHDRGARSAGRTPADAELAAPRAASADGKPKPRTASADGKPKPNRSPRQRDGQAASAPANSDTVTDLDEVRAIIDAAEAAERARRD